MTEKRRTATSSGVEGEEVAERPRVRPAIYRREHGLVEQSRPGGGLGRRFYVDRLAIFMRTILEAINNKNSKISLPSY